MTNSRVLLSRSAVLLASFVVVAASLGELRADDCEFLRGNLADLVNEGVVDLNDAVDIPAYLFTGTSVPPCPDAADANDNGLVELSDYAYLQNFLFADGPPPAEPFAAPGVDGTPGEVTVPDEPDPRFELTLGAGAGVPSHTGIEIPLTLTNDEPISGLQIVLQYNQRDEGCPDILIQEIRTEEDTMLSAASAEFIVADFDNAHGVAFIAALRDFATPFWFNAGSDPNFPAGEDQLVATLSVAIASCADMGFAPIEFADGVIVPDVPESLADRMAPAHNLVFQGDVAYRPVLVSDGAGVEVRRGFIRGDANKDDGVDLSDPVFLLSYVFLGGDAPPCMDAGDANNDTNVDVSDPVWLLNYLFQGGPQPSEPFPQAGVDPSDDGSGSLGCASDQL